MENNSEDEIQHKAKKLKLNKDQTTKQYQIPKKTKNKKIKTKKNKNQKDIKTSTQTSEHSITLKTPKQVQKPNPNEKSLSNLIRLLSSLSSHSSSQFSHLKSWLSLHFPELPSILPDPQTYCSFLNDSQLNFTSFFSSNSNHSLNKETFQILKKAFLTTSGAPLPPADKIPLLALSKGILESLNSAHSLSSKILPLAKKVAPSLVELLGEKMAVRLLGHYDSLSSLAEKASSTVQMWGTEKALFAALGNKKETPKFGTLLETKFVGMGRNGKEKGKLARSLSAKIVLCARMDSEGCEEGVKWAKKYRKMMERRVGDVCIKKVRRRGGKKGRW